MGKLHLSKCCFDHIFIIKNIWKDSLNAFLFFLCGLILTLSYQDEFGFVSQGMFWIRFPRDVLNQSRESSNTNTKYLKDANYVWSKHRLVGAQLGQLLPKPEGEVVRHHLWKWVIDWVQRCTDSAVILNSIRLKVMVPVIDFQSFRIELLVVLVIQDNVTFLLPSC